MCTSVVGLGSAPPLVCSRANETSRDARGSCCLSRIPEQTEVAISNGQSQATVCREAIAGLQTNYRWREEYGDLQIDQAKHLDGYAQKLIAATSSHQNLHFVDTRGTLVPEEWANELHPTPAGFNKLAKKWRPGLERAGLL